jgi:hypothetical protein
MHRIERERQKRPWILFAAGAALVLLCSYCSRGNRIQFEVYPEIQLRQDPVFRTQACQDTIEVLLTELWGTDFFHWQNPLLLEEILDNDYGIFECDAYAGRMSRFRAFYKREKKQDRIMLNKRLFRHIEASPGWGFKLTDMDRRIKSTLVHELLHDFWFNILEDGSKAGFAANARLFFTEIREARTRDQKIAFLKKAGYAAPCPSDFTPFAELLGLEGRYEERELFGTELYSILADRAFSGHVIIPRQLREYYDGILSRQALERDRR